MKQIRTPEGNDDGNDEGKLRRWVSNLQLESWQLELLITRFSYWRLVLISTQNSVHHFGLINLLRAQL